MLYQNNGHWHGEAALAALAAMAAVVLASVAVEEDSLTAVASAVEEDSSATDSINISYKQSTR